jgi:hypothetical protein
MQRLVLIVSAVLFHSLAQAEVIRSSELGFTIKHQADVTLPPPAAWAALSDIGRWWDGSHSFSGDARNLNLDPRVGGCFCEKLGMYAGVQHMTVIYAQPPKLLRLSGVIGPLQEFAVTGSLTWQIEVGGGGSRIVATYTVGGYADRPMSEWALLTDSVLVTQVERLARFINTGSPDEEKVPSKQPR